LFTRIERNAYAVLVVLALCAAVVLASPTPAQAQAAYIAEDTRSDHANARANLSHVVVRSGDSLWSISEVRLGPNATPQRVADAAERIHALNRGRIGADPDLIFVGQELSLPPALSEGPPGASAAPKTAHAAEAGPRDRAAKGTTGKAPRPVPRTAPAGGADAKGGEAPETAARQKAQPVGLPALPDVAVAAPVPAVRVVAADAGAHGRRLLGLGVLALTLLAAAVMAWKLPMRRATRGDAERWGTSSGYYGYHGETPLAPGATSFFYHPGSLGGPVLEDRDERDARREAPRAPGLGRRAAFAGGGTASSPGIARTAGAPAGRGRAPRAKAKAGAVPRNGLAVGAHNPEVRRAPRRARATMRARRLRPRLRHGRGVSARGGR